jgi:hypothetical protein
MRDPYLFYHLRVIKALMSLPASNGVTAKTTVKLLSNESTPSTFRLNGLQVGEFCEARPKAVAEIAYAGEGHGSGRH